MLNKYPNLRTPLSSFVNQRNMHTTLPRYLYNITVGYTSLLNTFFCWLEQQILQLPLCAIIWVTQNSISFFPFIGLLCKIASVLYLCCMAKCQPHNMCLIDLEMCPVYRDMKILIEVCSGYLSVLSVKPSILLYPAEFIKVFLVLIFLTCLMLWFLLIADRFWKFWASLANLSRHQYRLCLLHYRQQMQPPHFLVQPWCEYDVVVPIGHLQIFVDRSDMGLEWSMEEDCCPSDMLLFCDDKWLEVLP